MESSLHTAQALPCPHCGGVFPVAGLPHELSCPYCARAFAFDADSRQRLAAYQGRIQAALADAGENLAHVRAWQQASDPSRMRRLNLIVLAGALLLLLGGGLTAAVCIVLGLEQMVGWLTIAVPLGFMALILFVTVLASVAPRSTRASAGSHSVACPSCGAPNEMVVGQALERCHYCHAALVASARLVDAGLRAADAVRRAASIERHRLERAGALQTSSWNMENHLPYIVIGSFAVPSVIGATVMTFGMSFGSEPPNLLGLFAVWTMIFGLFGAMALVWQLRSLRERRYERVLDDLTLQIAGQRTPSVSAVVDWLNTHWPAPYNLAWLREGAVHGAAFGHVHGLPCMIHLDPYSSGKYHEPHAVLVVAGALRPNRNEQARTDPNAVACVEWLRRAGFEVRLEECGVLATASARTLAIIRREPMLAHLLITVLTTLAGLASVLRDSP